MTNTDRIWELVTGESPLVALAVHDGHAVRPDVGALSGLGESERLREEDPFTGEWTAVAPTRLVGLRSRFEVDLNRPRDIAVYREPQDAWGLPVWTGELPEEVVRRSLAEYDDFYACLRRTLDEKKQRHGRFFVFDLHTYNHRRDRDGAPADPGGNPQVNIGTGTMDRDRWAPVVDRFMSDLRAYPFPGGRLDVRENVKFKGGQVPRWIHETYPASGCSIAIEFKKFFMDEWTGVPDRALVDAIGEALRSTVPGVIEALARL